MTEINERVKRTKRTRKAYEPTNKNSSGCNVSKTTNKASRKIKGISNQNNQSKQSNQSNQNKQSKPNKEINGKKTNTRKPRKHPEDDFLQEVKKYLHSIGVYPLGYDEKKMKVRPIGYYEKRWGSAYTPSGMPDMHIMIHGLSVDVELKAANGRPSDLQLVKVQRINDWGGIGLIVYPKDFDHLKSLLESIRK